MLMKEIKEELIKQIGNVNKVHLPVLPKLIHRFYIIPIKIIANLFCWQKKQTLKFTWKNKQTRMTKTIAKEE